MERSFLSLGVKIATYYPPGADPGFWIRGVKFKKIQDKAANTL